MIQTFSVDIELLQLSRLGAEMVKLKPSSEFEQMMCIMFYQDAMDDHPDFETRFRDMFANGGYSRADKIAFKEFMEEATRPIHSDESIERLFESASCDWATPRGGHREILKLMLAELRRQL